MPRSARAVFLDLLVARKRVQDLQLELIAARLAERDRIVELAAQGKTIQEIARTMGMSRGAAQGILWRAGKSISGKTRMRRPRTVDLARMLDANLSEALRHRAPERQSVGRAS